MMFSLELLLLFLFLLLSPRSPSTSILILKSTPFQNTKKKTFIAMPTLISNQSLRYLHQQASDRSNTARLWMAIFSGAFPGDRQVYVVQGQLPANTTRRRVDAKVYCFVNGMHRDLIYADFKAPGLSDAERAEAEARVIRYCQTLLRNQPNTQSITAMLCIGPQVA